MEHKIDPRYRTINQLKPLVAPLISKACMNAKEQCQDMPDTGACGFAWVAIQDFECPDGKIIPINGRSKMGRALMDHEFVTRSHLGWPEIWASRFYAGQSLEAIEKVARLIAKELSQHGFVCYVGSRLD